MRELVQVILLFGLVCLASAQELPIRPYVDPSQLDVPWPKHSHLKIPWRAYLETRSGYEFLQGIGVNYNVPLKHELAIKLLAEAGFKTFRIEIGWSNVNWDETALANEGRWKEILSLCKRYGIRPTILLNAHHGVPCPHRFFERRLVADAPKGSRKVRLDNVSKIVPRHSGLCNLTDYMPEGWVHTFVQTESLTRLLNPKSRQERKPAGVERFYHYMTEHGVAPPECGVNDEQGSWLLKAKMVLRAFCFWFNKGIDVMHYYCAYGEQPTDMGLLPTNLKDLPDDAKFERVATLPISALRNLVRIFSDGKPLKQIRQLSVDVVALGKQTPIYTVAGKTLWHRDVFAFLPFQCHERKFVIAVYTMSYDATKPFSEERYRLTITGFGGMPRQVRLYDPLTDKIVPVKLLMRARNKLAVEVPVMDYPRLLVVAL